jgi:transposase
LYYYGLVFINVWMGDLEAITREALEGLRDQPDVLIALILRQMEAIAELRAEVRALQQRVAELEEQNRPPTAPFRRPAEQKSATPKKPGRPHGHPGSFRAIPQQIDEVIEVPLPGGGCPCCGGVLQEVRACVQHIEEILPARPHVTRLTTWEAWCPKCQKPVASSHPMQVSNATGSAGTHLGSRALALAAALKHELGLSFSKTCAALELFSGLRLTRGGLAQVFQRMGKKLQPDYRALLEELKRDPAIHTDETSWWINGPASLWVYTSPRNTFYCVVESRSRAQFHEIIPPEWKGVLVSDCLSVYDGATALQQKCYSHHFKALRIARADARDAQEWLAEVGALLHGAMDFKSLQETLQPNERLQRRHGFDLAARLLLERPRADPAEERLRARLFKQIDHLFTFLDHPAVEATNNLAERQLRPAVIARKLSCGNKTRKGADAWEVLASLAATCAQRFECFVTFAAPKLTLQGR